MYGDEIETKENKIWTKNKFELQYIYAYYNLLGHLYRKLEQIFNNYSPKAKWILSNNARDESRGDYSTIFTEPEEDNCFSRIAQMIIRGNCIFFHFTNFYFKNIKKSRGGHFDN